MSANTYPLEDHQNATFQQEGGTFEDSSGTTYPSGPKLTIITISLMLAVLCVALDNTVGEPIT